MDRFSQEIVDEIVHHVEDARDIAKLSVTCKSFQETGYNVRSMHVKVLNEDHEWARNLVDMSSPNSGLESRNLKDTVVNIIAKKHCIKQLCIEVEPRLQSKEVPENEGQRTDFWMSDPYFVRKWLPRAGATLQHLCIVDYGKQAIMRRSSVLKIISENCKLVKTLDLRNMYIDTSDCGVMTSMVPEESKVQVCCGDTTKVHATKDLPGGLLELLYGASSFGTFALRLERNRSNCKTLYVDIPCMALKEDGTFFTVSKDVSLNLPCFENLHNFEHP
uniref:F-box domain-containing protein n=1 Tax=Physcomitrium patens TaxID=3218 RepID=A0A7I4C8H5_PHYPA